MLSRITLPVLVVGIMSFGAGKALASPAPAQRQTIGTSSACRPADSAAIVRVANRFHVILSSGDTTGINKLLAPDLKVLEGGAVENREEYLSHHLAADIEFSKAVKEERTSFSYKCEGTLSWLVSTSNSTGKFRDREINNASAELLLLSRTPEGWRIRAIHWSSARRQAR
jgi:hypothetical protein